LKALDAKEFLAEVERLGMAVDPRYPTSAVLGFVASESEARFWEVPAKPERRSALYDCLLELCGDWKSCYAWRHLGWWPAAEDIEPLRINDVVEHHILKGLGLPLGTEKVVEFDRQELGALITLLFSTSVFGWSVGEDTYVVPDNGRYLLQTDHHNAIHVVFRDAIDVGPFVKQMAEWEFPLPDETPDATFKRPAWMSEPDAK
jgi:hypothetical protein